MGNGDERYVHGNSGPGFTLPPTSAAVMVPAEHVTKTTLTAGGVYAVRCSCGQYSATAPTLPAAERGAGGHRASRPADPLWRAVFELVESAFTQGRAFQAGDLDAAAEANRRTLTAVDALLAAARKAQG
jgi:hypothetical protein